MYLTLKLALDDGIEDFHISVFNKKWLSYGDVVIEIVKKGVIETTYAIKCKNVSNARQKLHSFKEIINIEKESDILNDLDENELFHNTKFAVFTTAQRPWNSSSEHGSSSDDENNVQSPLTAGAIPIKENVLIDVSRKEKAVFEFTSKNGRKVLLFTSQHIGPNKIDQLLKEKFEDYPDIVFATREFAKYINLWSNGKKGGNYSFRKIDTVLNLVQILLQDIVTEPIISNKSTGSNISYDKWNGIIDEVDITVLKNDPYVLSRISDPIIKIMENIFGTTIRAKRLINLDDEMVKSFEPEIRAYLFETVQELEEPISLKNLCYVLWKANKIPLLLTDKGKMRDVIFDIISFLKQKGYKRKFMYLSNDPASVTPKGDIQFFKNLRDIRQQVILSEIKLQVSKGPDLNLEQIVNSNPFFLKWVTPDIFLNLTLEKCSFKGIAPKHHTEHGNDLQIIVNSDRILKEIYQGICQSLDIEKEDNNFISFGNLRGMDPSLLSMNTLK